MRCVRTSSKTLAGRTTAVHTSSHLKGPVGVEDMSSLQFEEMEVCVRQPETVAPEDILEQLHLDNEHLTPNYLTAIDQIMTVQI